MWVFDLDNTLHNASPHIFPQINRAMTTYMQTHLGLDEAGVEENEMIGGSALTIGEYLSPRLYLSYGVGLFEPGEVIALRYKMSKDVGVKVQRGTEETRAGIEYRIER